MSVTVKDLKESAIQELASKIIGTVILPSDSRYDEARKVYNAMIDKRPGDHQMPHISDVIHAVNFGREKDAR
jgi:hypothetical protein